MSYREFDIECDVLNDTSYLYIMLMLLWLLIFVAIVYSVFSVEVYEPICGLFSLKATDCIVKKTAHLHIGCSFKNLRSE